jgi:hypothetical protein
VQRLLGNRQIDAVKKIDDHPDGEQKRDRPSSWLQNGFSGARGRRVHYSHELRTSLYGLALNRLEFPITYRWPDDFSVKP